MKLWLAKELTQEEKDSFLNFSISKLYSFAERNRDIITNRGIYVKRDNYVICFCGKKNEEIELFVVGAQSKINEKETLEEIISDSYPTPLEYEWKDIEDVELIRGRDIYNEQLGCSEKGE